MTRRTTFAALAIIAMVAVPAVLVAQGWGHGRSMGRGHGAGFGPGGPGGGPHLVGLLHRLGDRLELTAEQESRIEALVDEAMPAIQAIREEMRDAHHEARTPCQLGQVDEAEIRANVAAQAERMADLRVAVARLEAAVYAVLTPEQQQELGELCELMGDLRPRRGGRRFGGGS
jgi:Spy/CpxP family protein refolding chaperone